jgi:hypothetical protein
MPFKLGDVIGWTRDSPCTPTALAAITGKTPEEIGSVLRAAAKANGRDISENLRIDYDPQDWRSAIKLLDGNWTLGDDFSSHDFAQRPTIGAWMATSVGAEIELVVCTDRDERADGEKAVGHVFATFDREVVDTYTDGKRMRFTAVPPSYREFRVQRTFLVW